MSTNYHFTYIDLDNYLEPYMSSSPSLPNPDFVDYEINGVSMAGRFSASTKDWEKKMSGGGYYYNGVLIPACLKGYRPTIGTVFHTIDGSAGQGARDISITRSNSYITMSGGVTASFPPSSFRNNEIPMCIGILFCGGGGGGDDNGSGAGDDAWGGGGGGMALCVLSFEGLSFPTNSVILHLGEGGAVANNGGDSYLSVDGTKTVVAYHGQKGANTYSTSTSGGGGYGGSAGRLVNSHPNVFFIQGHKGGDGVGHSNTTTTLAGCPFYVTIATGDSQVMYGTPVSSVSANDTWGGPSLNGSYVAAETNGTNGAGGGGRDDKNGSNGSGGAGRAYFFY